MVEYGAVDIGGKSYVCPLRGVSVLLAHTAQPPLGAHPAESYEGPAKIFLNDAVFEQYRRFGSETRVLDENGVESAGNPPAPVAGGAVSTSPEPAPATSVESPEAAENRDVPAAAGETASAPAPVTVVAPAAPAEPEISIGTANGLPDQPATAALDQPSGYTLKVTSRLVDVSIVAYDRKGHPVKDLKAEDFEICDNGRPQEIRFFSQFASEAPAAPPAAEARKHFFSNQAFSDHGGNADGEPLATPGSEVGSTVLLLDESHIGWADLSHARQQILGFLGTLAPGEPVGLYTMTGLGFRVLAEITPDHAALIALLQKWMPTAQSVSQAQQEETRNRQQINEVHSASDLGSVNGNRIDAPDSMTSIDPQLRDLGSNPARAALIVIGSVARHLAVTPGHKNLVWVSSDNVLVDWQDQAVGIEKGSKHIDTYALRAQEAMNDAHVAFFPFDVSQLETAAIGADIQHRNVELAPAVKEMAKVPNDNTPGRTIAEMQQDIHPIQEPIQQAAEATGGRTVRRAGDLAAELAGIVEDGHAVYLASFSPQGPADGQYHAITVKLTGKQHGLTPRYRTGYLFSKDPATLKDRFQQAVWRPSDASEIAVNATVSPQSPGAANVNIEIRTGDLGLQQQAGLWMDKLDIFFIQRDDADIKAQMEGQTLGLRLKPSTYQRLLADGVPFEYFAQMQKGMASLRVLVVDENSGRMGSVTIPAPALEPAP